MSRSSCLAAVLLCAVPLEARDPDPSRVLTRTGEDSVAVLAALHGAQRKLREPACEAVLDDFRDAEGRLLRARLARFEMPAGDYVAQLFVADGGERRQGARCRANGVAAVTTPGNKVVYVCGPAFRTLGPGQRENVIIHEMLHTLGLGENPPGSHEINAAVRRRCGG